MGRRCKVHSRRGTATVRLPGERTRARYSRTRRGTRIAGRTRVRCGVGRVQRGRSRSAAPPPPDLRTRVASGRLLGRSPVARKAPRGSRNLAGRRAGEATFRRQRKAGRLRRRGTQKRLDRLATRRRAGGTAERRSRTRVGRGQRLGQTTSRARVNRANAGDNWTSRYPTVSTWTRRRRHLASSPRAMARTRPGSTRTSWSGSWDGPSGGPGGPIANHWERRPSARGGACTCHSCATCWDSLTCP